MTRADEPLKLDIQTRTYEKMWSQAWKYRLAWLSYEIKSKRDLALYLIGEAFFCTPRRVLDIGFGSGCLLFSLPRTIEICGTELVEAAVTNARNEARRRGYARAAFHIADASQRLPFGDATMDIVFCSHVIEHLENDGFLLDETRRVLKANGWLVALIPINEGKFENPRHVHAYTQEDFHALLRGHYFRVAKSCQSDRIWNLIGWYTEKDYHHRIPFLGPWISRAMHVPLALVPFRLMQACERSLVWLPYRQLGVLAQKELNG